MRLGAWGRSGELVGVVAAVEGDEVVLFDPAGRRTVRVLAAQVQAVPAGAVRVEVAVDLPLAHGLSEADLRRWVASLTDEVLRDRAAEALAGAELDQGAALAPVTVTVTAADGTAAICLAGHRSPTAGACTTCGREASTPPEAGGPGDGPASGAVMSPEAGGLGGGSGGGVLPFLGGGRSAAGGRPDLLGDPPGSGDAAGGGR
jgi:hypothetical protein